MIGIFLVSIEPIMPYKDTFFFKSIIYKEEFVLTKENIVFGFTNV